MRNLLISMVLVFGGCNNDDNTAKPDLSASNNDIGVSHDMAGFGCDPVKQDCGAGKKCTYVTSDPNDPTAGLTVACVAETGTVGLEMACDRNGGTDPGNDNCAAGFFCSVIGWGGTLTSPDRHCNKLCNTTADCQANHHCIPRTDFAGDCVRDCGTLESTSCGAGLACSSLLQDIDSTQNMPIVFLTCRGAGTGTAADACMDDTDCAGGFLCDTMEGTCSIRLCDDQHACPDVDGGSSCGALTNTDSLGICQ